MALDKKVKEERVQRREEKRSKMELQWIEDLKSDNERKVAEALTNIAKKGTIQSADALLELLISSKSETIIDQTKGILKSLKLEEMLDKLNEWIKMDHVAEHRPFLVSCFWESGLPSEAYFVDIAEAGIKGDYLTLLESLTVIENFAGSLPEDQIMDVSLSIDEEMESADESKAALLFSLKEVIHAMG